MYLRNNRRVTHSMSRGFTLLEILVAMAILAVVSTLVYTSFSGSLKAIDRVGQEADVYRDARFVLSRMSEEISMAYWPGTQGSFAGVFAGQNARVGGVAMDTLQFTALSHFRILPDELSTDLTQITYSLERNPETERWSLLHHATPHFLGLAGIPDERFVIGEGIHGLNLRYFDGTDWWDRWDTAEKNALPKVVEVEVIFMQSNGKEGSVKTWVRPGMSG